MALNEGTPTATSIPKRDTTTIISMSVNPLQLSEASG